MRSEVLQTAYVSVLMSPRKHKLKNHESTLRQIFCACCLWRRCLGPPLAALRTATRYVLSVLWVTSCFRIVPHLVIQLLKKRQNPTTDGRRNGHWWLMMAGSCVVAPVNVVLSASCRHLTTDTTGRHACITRKTVYLGSGKVAQIKTLWSSTPPFWAICLGMAKLCLL